MSANQASPEFKYRRLSVAVLLLLFLPIVSMAQTQNGNIIGTVKDSTGAVVAGAKLELTEQQTGIKRSLTSDEDGTYRAALLPAGTYKLVADHPGFKRFVNQDIQLATNQTLRSDVVLEVGQATESVTVEAEAASITTDSSEITSVKGRQFIDYQPSVLFNSAHQWASQSIAATDQQFSFYGSRGASTTMTVDGAQFDFWNDYVLGYAIQEVKAEALLAPAKYQTNVTINTVTKQGGNSLHGMTELTIYNRLFVANSNPRAHVDNCTAARPCTGWWSAGLTGTGPVYIPKLYDGRNRTFWMFTYTPQKNFRSDVPITNIVPTADQRAGDFSTLPGIASVVDPQTGQPFPGNRVPASRINPVTQKLLALFPQPSVAGTNTANVNSKVTDNVWYTLAARVDQKISDKNLAMFSFTRYVQLYGTDFADRSVAGYMGIAEGAWRTGTYVFADTYTISPTMVNEVRLGVNWEGPTGYYPQGIDASQRIQSLGLTNIPAPRATQTVTGPDITGFGFTPFLGWSNSYTTKDRFYHLADNLSIQRGRHTIQTGVDFKWANDNSLSAPETIWPAYTFNGTMTASAAGAGNAFVDFLLGLPGQVNRTNQRPEVDARKRTLGAFVQDDWRVSPRLTLNLGVRYDWLGAPYDASGLYFNYDPVSKNIVVPNQAALGQVDPAWNFQRNPIVVASQAGFPSKLINSDLNNLYPRVGFAYRPFNDQNFVIRGGYGIYVVPDTSTTSAGLLQTGGPYALAVQFNNTLTNGVPLLQWPNGWPSVGGTYRGTPSITAISPNWVYPYNQQWNFTIEKALRGNGLRLSYIGTKDSKLGYSRNINLPPPSTIPFTPDRYVNPNYVGITMIDNGGTTHYHGFEANFRVRNYYGLTGEFGYSWAKQMSDLPFNTFEGISGVSIPNPYCRTCERARSEIVPGHRAFAAFNFDVPVGRGKAFGRTMPRFADYIVGNWLLTSTIRARTGLFITPTYSGLDVSNTNTPSGRPDLVGNPNLPADQRSYDRWYNVAAFAIPPANAGRFGNAGRNVVVGPGAVNMNLGIFKPIPIREKQRLVFSLQSSNVLNKVNYGFGRSPGSINGINSPTPGYLTALVEDYSTRGIFNYMRNMFANVRFEF